jgi:hypothetical protein
VFFRYLATCVALGHPRREITKKHKARSRT